MHQSRCRFLFMLALASAGMRVHCACDALPVTKHAAVDYSAVQTIFNQHCTSCHTGSSSPKGLQLTEFRSYTLLVDVASDEVPNVKRVKPGSANSSYLFQKINCDAPKAGVRMPSDGKLSLDDQALIRDWINQGALAANEAPMITSGLIASATTAKPAQRISFSAATSDPNNDALTFAWNFGDGITRAGDSVQHAYTSPGVYTASLTVSDGRGGTASANATITIDPDTDFDDDGIADGIDDDDDNDGVPDAVESALNFSPTDATSTPFQGIGSAPNASLTLSSLSSKLDFARVNNDALTARGTFTIAAGETLHDLRAVLVVGNLTRVFLLNSRGSTLSGAPDKFSVKFGKTGVFSLRFSHAALASDLLSEDLAAVSTSDKSPQSTRVFLFVNGAVYTTQATLLYSRKSSRASLTLQK